MLEFRFEVSAVRSQILHRLAASVAPISTVVLPGMPVRSNSMIVRRLLKPAGLPMASVVPVP